eukprot:3215688-Rhodomonas_salina.2
MVMGQNMGQQRGVKASICKGVNPLERGSIHQFMAVWWKGTASGAAHATRATSLFATRIDVLFIESWLQQYKKILTMVTEYLGAILFVLCVFCALYPRDRTAPLPH